MFKLPFNLFIFLCSRCMEENEKVAESEYPANTEKCGTPPPGVRWKVSLSVYVSCLSVFVSLCVRWKVSILVCVSVCLFHSRHFFLSVFVVSCVCLSLYVYSANTEKCGTPPPGVRWKVSLSVCACLSGSLLSLSL